MSTNRVHLCPKCELMNNFTITPKLLVKMKDFKLSSERLPINVFPSKNFSVLARFRNGGFLKSRHEYENPVLNCYIS
jgi:hypothetical protein